MIMRKPTWGLTVFVRSIVALVAMVVLAASSGCTEQRLPSPSGEMSEFGFRAANNPALRADVAVTLSGTTFAATVPFGTNVTALVATFTGTGMMVTVGGKEQISDVTPNDFTAPVTYMVTAADLTTRAYTVTVSVAPSSAKDITRFAILGVDGTISGTSISLQLPFGTDRTNLAPTVAITGASVSPASGGVHDFTAPVIYTVTAADLTTKAYTVTVSVASSSAKDLTRFAVLGIDGTISGTNVALTVPFGTDRTSLTPTVVITGASVSPGSGVARDFTAPVVYTVTAADLTTKAYTVTVSVAPSGAKDITRFTILGVDGTISGTNISLRLPFGTNRTSLTPTVAITGASVSPAGGVPRDFSAPVTYTVTAADLTTKAYTVTVSVAPSSAKDITRFAILGVDGTISGTNISLTVPFGTDRRSLAPTVAITGASVSPASGVVRDFTAPVTYTVTAADMTTKAYTVTVTAALGSAKDLTRFTVLGVEGAISGTNISLTVPFGTDVTSLTPTVAITGASVSPASGVPHNFTTPATYTVTADDMTTRAYTVTVSVAPSGAKDITQFSILGVDGTISGTNISLTLPFGTDRSSLTPTVAIAGASVSPASGVTRDFTAPVVYVVTADDLTAKAYTVTVSVAPSSAKDITQLTILGVDATISGANISLTVPFGADLTSLTPTVSITGASVSPASGVAQDFTAPVVYTVTAEDLTTKAYSVSVSLAPSNARDITQFTILGVDADISGTSISLTVPFGTDVTSLTPTVAITGASVSPASGDTQDFTAPVVYTVTAADQSTKPYTVTVNVAPSGAKDITQFSILGVDGDISGTSISLTVPFGTDVTSLTPTVTITGASVSPASGDTQDFTAPVVYTVTAANLSTQAYTVTVNVWSACV